MATRVAPLIKIQFEYSNTQFFEPPDNSNQKSFPSSQYL